MGQPSIIIIIINGSVTVPKANTFVQNMHERISQDKLCLQQAQARHKAYADKHRRDVSFTEADQLLSTKIKESQRGFSKINAKMDWSFPHFQAGWYSCGKIGLTP